VNFLVRKQVSLSCRLGDQTLVLAMLAQFGQGLPAAKVPSRSLSDKSIRKGC